MLSLGEAGSLVPHTAVDLPPSPDGSSFEMFRRNSAPLMEVSLDGPDAAARFAFKALIFQLPGAVIARARGPAFRNRRGVEHIRHDPAPVIQVSLKLCGTTDIQFDGRSVRTGPGDILFQDYARPFSSSNADYELVFAMVTRDRAPPVLLEAAANGALMAAEGGPARLIAAALTTLHDTMPRLTIAQGELAVDAFCRLAADLLGDQLGTRGGTEQPPETTLDAALLFIEKRLADRMLDAAGVARHFGISRSALYRLFQPLGGVDEAIRVRRLDRAMRAILSGAPGDLEAARGAFRNEEHFARAFKARFGERPAQFRAKVESHDEAWLSAQALRAGFPSQEAWLNAMQPKA